MQGPSENTTLHERATSAAGDRRTALLLFALALITRVVAWPRSDVVDADAVTRALLGENYMRYPGWCGDGIWLPLHFYLNGIATVLCNSRVVGSVLVNIVLGSALVFPLFAWVRRSWDRPVAIAATLLVAFDPLVFRSSLQGLSEIPFLFFALCAFNAFSIARTDPSPRGDRQARLAGLYITIASGIRYEAWILIAFLALLFVLARQWRRAGLFLSIALLFPAAWMITDAIKQGDPFHGVRPEAHVADNTSSEERWSRTLFFPLSLLAATAPLALLLGLLGTLRAVMQRWWDPLRTPWLALFPLFLWITCLKARHGELLLQHRHTLVLLLVLVPWFAYGFAWLRPRLVVPLAVLCIAWGLYGSLHPDLNIGTARLFGGEPSAYLAWSTQRELEPVPTMDRSLPDALVERIDAIPMDRKLLVIDFFGWEQTYNTAFRVKVISTSVVFLPGDGDPAQGLAHTEDYMDHLRGPHGVLVLAKSGPYFPRLQQEAGLGTVLPLPHSALVLTPAGEVQDLALFTFTQAKPHRPAGQ